MGSIQRRRFPQRRGARSRRASARIGLDRGYAWRGIWIVDNMTPLRNLTQDTLAKDVFFLQGRNTQQRLLAQGGWTDGDGTFVGQNPPDAALITYYQKKRHVYGRMKIEVFDSAGKLVDTLPANGRLGISRVQWSMRMKAPKVFAPPPPRAKRSVGRGCSGNTP